MVNIQGCRCLIADHDVFMRRMLREMLRYFGIGRIEEVGDGGQAVFQIESESFDLLIIELKTPILCGKELISRVRRSKAPIDTSIPIIGYTDGVTPESVSEWRDAGISEIMLKPFSSGVLYKKLNSVLLTPRPFVRTEHYVGPCRRRKKSTGSGYFRRKEDKELLQSQEAKQEPSVAAPAGAVSQAALSQQFKK